MSSYHLYKLILRYTVACLIFLSTCHAMSSTEATFRCKASIEKVEDISNSLNNADLKRVAKAAISMMQTILQALSHDTASKDLPSKTYQCIQQVEHVTWLKESIEPAIQAAQPDSKLLSQKTASETETTKNKSASKKSKREQKKEEKKIAINQRNLDAKSLEKVLKSENDSKTKASKSAHSPSSKTLAPSL